MPSVVSVNSSSSIDDDLDLEVKYHPLISQLINSYIKKPNFVSTDLLKVAENNNRLAWSMTGTYGNKYNKALALALFKYLRSQRCYTNVSKSVTKNIIKNHYQNQVRVFQTSAEKIMARNKGGRKCNRKKTLHTFITSIDKLTVICLKKNSESLKKCIPYEKEVSIHKNLTVTLPDWCFSK
ncbi:hypothetical protein PHYBLDRAFT_72776 [Phycomyces blakesleeanus NRRL 1555(-)]|uniref:Homeodomain-like DNA binding domain-containing transcription factor n=1 Tax=Phycomyces blakesleeanus (strain ATCC 8743b / DSM 1359 / FGSC 10004 / NBRC 33097 / NRRL 1555) TaxID=763407 RepID=A0A167RB61_PHYB8|nr:hypothetical protein PHYBLDRAFT_72776 [Phycomyces blakesleeanus NRRL 1555(-)]OAD81267.1 hypothetical protein PHYBLDRAFT_72776 [Phycomyces blakesleeanus NRRL 1555(-)]|eukprot:XP_018299307.1 hypothetical protein PHYBLDRAFT_72776 [Phycomyces blakesleeanus NRRL 1555(-)]